APRPVRRSTPVNEFPRLGHRSPSVCIIRTSPTPDPAPSAVPAGGRHRGRTPSRGTRAAGGGVDGGSRPERPVPGDLARFAGQDQVDGAVVIGGPDDGRREAPPGEQPPPPAPGL